MTTNIIFKIFLLCVREKKEKKKICHMQKIAILLLSHGAATVGGSQTSIPHISWERYVPTRSASDRTMTRPPISMKQL